MEENRIKSAREIAMEKVARMTGFTPEELRKQKEKECVGWGEAIAKKYLAGTIRGADLQFELGKHHNGERQIVRRALISALGRAIDFGNVEKGKRAIEGMHIILEGDGHWEETKKELTEIVADSERRVWEMCQTLETSEKERLRALGISGSAIRPNVLESEACKRQSDDIRQEHALRVKRLQEGLMRYAESRLAELP